MTKKLKRRITLLFSSLSILVMLLVVVTAFYLAVERENRYQLETLTNLTGNVVKTITLMGRVEYLQIESLEREGVYVYLEDSGRPLQISERFPPDLIREVRGLALEQGVDLDNWWNSSSLSTHFLYSVRAREDMRVLVQQISSANDQWVTLIAFQDRTGERLAIGRMRTIFGLLAVAAAAALFAISWLLAGAAIKPTKESLRLQKEFISAASHEIRTPLAVIKSNLAAMALRPGEREQFSHVIHGEVDRLAQLTNDLTLMGDTGIAAWGMRKEPVNLDTLLLGLYESYEPLASQSNHKLSLELPESPLPSLLADENRLGQMLAILLNNAVSHTAPGTRIRMGGAVNHRKVVLFVSDNGAGIPKEHQRKVFQTFYQVDRGRSGKQHMGLGLSIAREIAELHGGKLVYRPSEGGGATFEFSCPTGD